MKSIFVSEIKMKKFLKGKFPNCCADSATYSLILICQQAYLFEFFDLHCEMLANLMTSHSRIMENFNQSALVGFLAKPFQNEFLIK